jgi:hypothetical protein
LDSFDPVLGLASIYPFVFFIVQGNFSFARYFVPKTTLVLDLDDDSDDEAAVYGTFLYRL